MSRALTLVATSLLLAGCASTASVAPDEVQAETRPVDPEELRLRLSRFNDRFVMLLNLSTQAVDRAAPERTVLRRRLILWKVQLAGFARQTLVMREPARALIDMWALCLQLDQLARRTRDQIEPLSPEPRRHAREALEQIEAIAARVLTAEDLPRVRQALDGYVAERPLLEDHGPTTPGIRLTRPSDDDALDWIVQLLAAPAKVLLDDTARAIEGFGRTADRFTEVVKLVPEQLSWRLELLSFDLQHGEAVGGVRGQLGAFNTSAARAVDRLEALPQDLRALVDHTATTLPARVGAAAADAARASIDRVVDAQPELRQTLGRAEALVSEARGLVADARPAATDVTRGAARAGTAWAAAFHELRLLAGPGDGAGDDLPPEDEPSRPFDILEYATTARQVGVAGDSLRDAVAELRALVAERDAVTATVDASADRASTLVHTALTSTDDIVRGWILLAGAVAAGVGVLLLAGLAWVLRRARS